MEEAFNNVRELVRHCHIHDVRKSDGGWELCLLGEGEIPHDFVVRRLHEINFDGHLSGEFINPRWEPHVILSQYSEVLHRYLDELTG
ncbi:MAG TPA: hypothetical protein EYP10_00655 [Armatimonadetes bacterium]|nr:hypothetical protein [Armatimonadota bacterium]